jgi:hypothetical protein
MPFEQLHMRGLYQDYALLASTQEFAALLKTLNRIITR